MFVCTNLSLNVCLYVCFLNNYFIYCFHYNATRLSDGVLDAVLLNEQALILCKVLIKGKRSVAAVLLGIHTW